ncbi:MAG: Threonine-tRNA ligase [Parcubacteria group bacterium GW2011_GWF2_42_7]|nr:MAG: Threonine-tRNA ligase [Parcubacteria group bacterium GW2011_GWF2_42_7]
MSNEIENIRHSFSHILAMAVLDFWPEAKLGIGPVIENGFYYDFDLKYRLSPDDLPKIEKKIKAIIAQNIKFERKEVSVKQAKEIFSAQPFKLELIEELKNNQQQITIYKSGDFTDLCAGPHIDSTKELNPDTFKLTKVAGAYWKGSEKNPQLQRVYGLAFGSKKELDAYLKLQEEAEKRDHRKLGKELELFSFQEDAPGFVFWHPKGMILRGALMKIYDKLINEAEYQVVSTPILLAEELWRKSGHWDNYKDQMYFTEIDGKTFVVKPMNCPGVILIYKSRPRSYRELPLRLSEAGEVHRHEPSGTLMGLFRVRAFRQDDAHIFVKEDQIESEVKNIIKLVLKFYKMVGFNDVKIELSTRPEKSMGSDEIWEKAEGALQKTLKNSKLKFKINEGDGAFYGPKIDFHIKDSLGRSWQCATIQVDFSMPERFGLKYIDKDGAPKQPVIIHRTIIGSIQRFVGILIEHYAGAFPVWLAPEQIWVIPIGAEHKKYANEIGKALDNEEFRFQVKDENETVSKKIREGEIQKIPYLLIVGDKEVKAKKISVRQRGKRDLGPMTLKKFLEKISAELSPRLS